MRIWHIPLGPLLYREDPPIYFPGKGDQVVLDYYAKTSVEAQPTDTEKAQDKNDKDRPTSSGAGENGDAISTAIDGKDSDSNGTNERPARGLAIPNPNRLSAHIVPRKPEPEERWLHPVRDLPVYHPKKLANWTKYALLQGVSRDVVTQKSKPFTWSPIDLTLLIYVKILVPYTPALLSTTIALSIFGPMHKSRPR